MTSSPDPKPTSRWRTYLRHGLRLLALILLLLAGLVAFNGIMLGDGETPRIGTTGNAPRCEPREGEPIEVKVMAFNIAKCFAYKGGIRFEDRRTVLSRVREMADMIRQEDPDLVFLSETIVECDLCPVNQVEELAKWSNMHCWAFGENYNFGLPFFRIRGGNAILSRWPLTAVSNRPLPGRKPFYITKNSRRALWCSTRIGSRRLLLGSVHNDSFDADNNVKQIEQLLGFSKSKEAEGYRTILAGDFNARPGDPSIDKVRKSGRFTGEFAGPPTFPSDKPESTIDYVFAPKSWKLIEHRVIESELSDHRPVVSTFRLDPND